MNHLTTQLRDGVLSLGLNRPDSLNAFIPEMLEELYQALQQSESNNEVRVVVLKGEGKAFSAGVDLKVLQGIDPAAGKIGDVFDEVANRVTSIIRHNSKPVIAQVHGACFTGALEIALSCDFIIAESSTKFGDTHAKWGLRPTWGMAQNLARAVGVRRARQLSFSAVVFSGEQAAQWGLATECVEGVESLAERVASIANEIAQGSSGAVSAYKELYRLAESQLGIEASLVEENKAEFPEINDTMERLGGFGKK